MHRPLDIRDQFAMAALTGICANEAAGRNFDAAKRAEIAYRQADAMMKTRGPCKHENEKIGLASGKRTCTDCGEELKKEI